MKIVTMEQGRSKEYIKRREEHETAYDVAMSELSKYDWIMMKEGGM